MTLKEKQKNIAEYRERMAAAYAAQEKEKKKLPPIKETEDVEIEDIEIESNKKLD